MKKRISHAMAVLAMLLMATPVMAQYHALQVVSFTETNDDDATNPLTMHAYKQNGQERLCAIIKVKAPVDGLQFEGRIEGAPERKGEGEYWVYMYGQSTRLKVLHQGSYPVTVDFANYGNKQIDFGKCYSLVLTQVEEKVNPFIQQNSFTLGLGYNIVPYGGLSLSLGYDYKWINFEVVGTYGIASKTDVTLVPMPLYGDNVYYKGVWSPAQVQAHLGFDISFGRHVALTPQVGLAMTFATWDEMPDDEDYNYTANGMNIYTESDDYEDVSCMSLTLGARFQVALSKSFRLQITPQYNLPISKNDEWKAVSDVNKDVKSWADGFALNAGLMFYF